MVLSWVQSSFSSQNLTRYKRQPASSREPPWLFRSSTTGRPLHPVVPHFTATPAGLRCFGPHLPVTWSLWVFLTPGFSEAIVFGLFFLSSVALCDINRRGKIPNQESALFLIAALFLLEKEVAPP